MAWQDRRYNRDDTSFNLHLGFTPPSRMAIYLIAACIGVFILQSISGPDRFLAQWAALPPGAKAFYQPWRFITYQYLHGGSWHIFWNILGIYFFLSPLERHWGWQKALGFYTAGGVVAGLAFEILSLVVGNPAPLIGASGSILAALGACALLFPEMTVYLIVIPISIRALAVLAGLLYLLAIIGEQNLSHAAHLGGLAFGVLAPWWGGPTFHRFQRRMHLRRVRVMTDRDQQEQDLVDRILQKVHDHGMHSLTWAERRALRKATERQRQRDLELSRKRA